MVSRFQRPQHVTGRELERAIIGLEVKGQVQGYS